MDILNIVKLAASGVKASDAITLSKQGYTPDVIAELTKDNDNSTNNGTVDSTNNGTEGVDTPNDTVSNEVNTTPVVDTSALDQKDEEIKRLKSQIAAMQRENINKTDAPIIEPITLDKRLEDIASKL